MLGASSFQSNVGAALLSTRWNQMMSVSTLLQHPPPVLFKTKTEKQNRTDFYYENLKNETTYSENNVFKQEKISKILLLSPPEFENKEKETNQVKL